MSTRLATIHTVTRHRRIGGEVLVHSTIHTGLELPFKVLHRVGRARTIGLDYVRSLGDNRGGSIVAVSVSDGRRPLASWRSMPTMGHAFTGTHDVHELITEALPQSMGDYWRSKRESGAGRVHYTSNYVPNGSRLA